MITTSFIYACCVCCKWENDQFGGGHCDTPNMHDSECARCDSL
jgi:hypothetical protein